MKSAVKKAIRRRIALPTPFAQNMRTHVFGFAEAFGVRPRPRVAFRSSALAVIDPTLPDKPCNLDTTFPIRDTHSLSHAS
jgi:hypothetical protein